MPAGKDYGKLLSASPTARTTRFRRGVRRHACKHLCQLNRIKNNGRARLLPSWRRNGSAGASPSRSMNWLGKVNVKMFTGVASPASPSRYKHCCGLPCRDSTSEGPRSSTIAATGILPSEVAMHKIAFAAGNRPLRRLSVSKFDFLVHDAWPLALGEFYSSYWSWQSRERNIRPYYPHLRHIEIRFR